MSASRIWLHSFDSALGRVHCGCTETGLAIISIVDDAPHAFEHAVGRLFPDAEYLTGGSLNKRVENQVTAYANCRLKTFDLPLVWRGTEFRQRVLQAVATIPFGEVRSYGEVAMMVGHPRAARAVGTAMKGNHLPLVVPCHRVVAAHGIGGYGGTREAIEVKKQLLRHEGFDFRTLEPSRQR